MTRPPKALVDELARTGLPWELAAGRRHYQVRLCNRMVGIIPLNNHAREGRAMKNVIAQVRRAALELQA